MHQILRNDHHLSVDSFHPFVGTARIVRADPGTENVKVEVLRNSSGPMVRTVLLERRVLCTGNQRQISALKPG